VQPLITVEEKSSYYSRITNPFPDPSQSKGNWGPAVGENRGPVAWALYTNPEAGEAALPAANVTLGAKGTNLCWGYTNPTPPATAPSTIRRVVFADLPTIAGSITYQAGKPAPYVKLQSDVSVTIRWPGQKPQTWQYSYTLQRLPGHAATFSVTDPTFMGNDGPPRLGPVLPPLPPIPSGG
jgi:hypothetical protein